MYEIYWFWGSGPDYVGLGGSVIKCIGKGCVSLQTHSKAMDNGRTSRHKSHALMPEDIIHTIFFSMFFISSKHLGL